MAFIKQLDWEALWGAIFILGMIVSLMIASAIMYYVIAGMMGILFGRFAFKSKSQLQFKHFMIFAVFIFGFIAGNVFTGYGDAFITVGVYLLGMIISTAVHEQGNIDAIDF